MIWIGHHNEIEISELLIDSNADINIIDNDGMTALMYAEDLGYTEIVDLLKAVGTTG